MDESSFTWILEEFFNSCNSITTEIWNLFFNYIVDFFAGDIITKALNMTVVRTAVNTVSIAATIFLGILASKHIITTYYLETDGDRDMDPLQYLVKVTMATAIIQSAGFLTNYIMKLSKMLFNELIGEQIYENLSVNMLTDIEQFTTKFASSALSTLYILVFVICIFILLMKAAIRIAEVVCLRLLLPVFACSIITPSREMWNTFFKSYFTTLFGYIIQIFFLNLSTLVIVNAENRVSLILALGCLFFSLKAPKWLDNYVYTTGAGQSTHSLMYMAPQVLKAFK